MACMFQNCNVLGDVKPASQVNGNIQIFFQVATIEVDRNHESWTRVCSVSQLSEMLIIIFISCYI